MDHKVFDNRLRLSLRPYLVDHTQLSHLTVHAGSLINLPSALLNIHSIMQWGCAYMQMHAGCGGKEHARQRQHAVHNCDFKPQLANLKLA